MDKIKSVLVNNTINCLSCNKQLTVINGSKSCQDFFCINCKICICVKDGVPKFVEEQNTWGSADIFIRKMKLKAFL